MARNGIAGLSPQKIREFARAGAEATLHTLRAEIAAIERAFPDLASRRPASMRLDPPTRHKRRMSVAARKAISDRMKR